MTEDAVVVTRDKSWRNSTFNVCLGGGSCWIDFKDSPRRVVGASFDGAGYLPVSFGNVPGDLWDALVGDLPNEGDQKELAGQQAASVKEHMAAFFRGCSIPDDWKEDFRGQGVL